MKSILLEIGKEGLINYLNLMKHAGIKFDYENAFKICSSAVKYFKGSKEEQKNIEIFREMQDNWYKSVYAGKPDYGMYNTKEYLFDVWSCWVVYSRQYIRCLTKTKTLMDGKSLFEDMKRVKEVADLGCGFGYTTAGLKEIFPDAKVYGTNLKESLQWKTAVKVGRKRGFTMKQKLTRRDKPDFIFASEYFEHFESPLAHLQEILDVCSPRYLIIANAFNADALGHFDNYLDEKGNYHNGKAISRMFNNKLRAHGFEKVKTNLWNSRPTYWRFNQYSIDKKRENETI